VIDSYRLETDRPLLPLGEGSTGPAVRRVQEWLGLHGVGVAIDGDYGPATRRGVESFQRNAIVTLPDVNGVVDHQTWRALVAPLAEASEGPLPATFGDAAILLAARHLKARAREVGGDNRGPWVRHYCRGQSVAWCQGFASTIWADAARRLGRAAPIDLVIEGIWCLWVPRVAQEVKACGLFLEGARWRAGESPAIPRGSMFFLKGGPHGYLHVGLVDAVLPDGTMSTYEGNTNDDGSANGYEVARRIRRVAASDFGLAA